MTRSTECEEFGDELSALLDGELAPARAARVRDHVDGCARCRAELASLERVGPWLARVPVPPVREDQVALLRARIAQERAPARVPRRAPARARTLRRSLAAVALAAAAALALYLAVGRPRAPLAPEVAPEPRVARSPEPASPPVVPEPDVPAPAPPAPAPQRELAAAPPDPEFDRLPAEEIAVGLDLDTAQDLDVIANIDLLEAYIAQERS